MAAAVVGALAFGAGTTPASADLTVVSALVSTGSSGGQQSQTVSLLKLQTCPLFSGPSSMTMHPGGQPVGIPPGSSWTLAWVLKCGLSIDPSGVTSLTVIDGGTGAFETALTSQQLTDTSLYRDGGGVLLPMVSVLSASTGQIQYARPWLGGADTNATDTFVLQPDSTHPSGQPISVIVQEKEPPLRVKGVSAPVTGSLTTSSEQYRLSATVTTADGGSVSPSDLTWNWSVNGQSSADATPTVSFPTGSSSPVSVQVYDAAAGIVGTTTFDVTVPSGPAPPSKGDNKPGAGKHKHGSQIGNHNGRRKATGNNAPKPSHQQKPTTHHEPHKAPHTQTGSGHQTQTTPESSTTPPATTAPATPPPTPPSATPTTTPGLTPVNGKTKPPHHHHAAWHHAHRNTTGSHHTAHGGGTSSSSPRRVTGRLVADVEPLRPSSSPLVRTARASDTNAPLVHAASTSTSLPAWLYATAAVVVLLAAGAEYERRGRRARSLHR